MVDAMGRVQSAYPATAGADTLASALGGRKLRLGSSENPCPGACGGGLAAGERPG